MQQFKKIGLMVVYGTDEIIESCRCVADHLIKLDVEVFSNCSVTGVVGVHIVELGNLFSLCDCLVVIGGDGSLLSVAATACHYSKPLIGINRGRLGFLSDIKPDRLDELTEMLSGKYHEESRSMLAVKLNEQEQEYLALNEIVLFRSEAVRLIEYEIYIDQRFVCYQRADGLIVSTPTGSTAYGLSAGGPILQPGLNAMCLVPLNPHRLNSRPIVTLNKQTIDLHVLARSRDFVGISCDGLGIEIDEKIVKASIRQADHTLTLLHPLHYDYFETLKSKLHWERKGYVNEHKN